MTKSIPTGRAVLWVTALLAAFAAACGGPDRTPPGDGGPPVDLGSTPDLGPPGCTSSAGCADSIDCTTDTCDTATGTCRHILTPALCASGESCNPMTGCEAGHACATDTDCEDMDACTTSERCDPAARVCTYQPLDGDADGDPPRVCGGTDCDDSNANVYLGAPERCDNLDDDCGGTVDEGASAACGMWEACVSGTCECVSDRTRCAGQCTDLTSDPLNCGACGVHDGASCTNGVGACARSGVQVCTASALVCSAVAGSPSSEVCNGVDDDCDGTVDDGVCVPCPAGYTGFDGTCTDVDECLIATTCGGGRASCTNNDGSYVCGCQAGYAAPATGGTCTDIDECAAPRTDDCDRDPAATCVNTPGSFTCACPAGFTSPTGDARGASGCLLSDPSLASLVPSTGTLNPAFDSGTTMYTLALPFGATSITLTPSVAYPARVATLTVDGVTVASGAASAPISLLDFAPRPILVTVTTETGATRTYAVVVGRGSAYVKASNTEANDNFGYAVSLSADGTRLAVGAYGEGSSATGIGGNQADNSATLSGAVYVFARAGTTWAQEAYVKASNTEAGDNFGVSVSLSADGTRLAVGASGEDSSATGLGGNQADNSAAESGAVYVY